MAVVDVKAGDAPEPAHEPAHEPPRADIHLTAIPHAAGGLGAINATMRHLWRDSGLIRGGRALLALNQPEGFDCPGCAWPEPGADTRARFEFCENGAKAIAEETTTARATPELFASVTIDELRGLSDFELGQLGRLTHPMVLDGRHYRALPWDDAMAICAEELRAAGPHASALYTSGRTSNEAAFLYQLVGRMFGTNNFPDCSNMCHESSGVALSETIGVGKGTVSLADFEHADLVLVIGQNPGTNHPRMLTTLREVARRGTTIIAINPLREVGLVRFSHPQHPLDVLGAGTNLAAEHIRVQIGGDLALFAGIAKAMFEREDAAPGTVLDHEFLAARTAGVEAYRAHIAALSWTDLVTGAGITEAAIRELADRYMHAERVIACWAMGLTQHKHSVAMIQEVTNVMLLRGNLGRPGAGLCPVRGHSNVQGDRTMGIDHLPKPAFLDALGAACGFEPPRTKGLDVVESLQAMLAGEVDALFCVGGNLLSASPDTARTARALSSCAFTASVSTKLNRTHLYPGKRALILPCLGRSERDVQTAGTQFVTVEDSMSMVHRSHGVLAPAGPELRSEIAIVGMLGKALLGPRMPWDDLIGNYDLVRDLIARVVPGFTDFNARVRTPNGFQLPNSARDRTLGNMGGRARFTVSTPPDLALAPGQLRMMTIRSHDQYNTTIYGLDDRYRGIKGERRVVFVDPADMVAHGLIEREIVDLVSHWHDGERVAHAFIVVPYDLPRGNCATYFPEANALIPLDSTADKSNTPTSKSVIVTIRRRV